MMNDKLKFYEWQIHLGQMKGQAEMDDKLKLNGLRAVSISMTSQNSK